MNKTGELLAVMRRLFRLYDRLGGELCTKHGLSRTELDILAFLSNHPEYDTAREISEQRMLQKSNVSIAVEQLIGKGLLTREADGADRRLVHLHLTVEAEEFTREIAAMQRRYRTLLFADVSEEEQRILGALLGRIAENALHALERGCEPDA